jgi:hypothetical protein
MWLSVESDPISITELEGIRNKRQKRVTVVGLIRRIAFYGVLALIPLLLLVLGISEQLGSGVSVERTDIIISALGLALFVLFVVLIIATMFYEVLKERLSDVSELGARFSHELIEWLNAPSVSAYRDKVVAMKRKFILAEYHAMKRAYSTWLLEIERKESEMLSEKLYGQAG